ncbi:serine/threonine-protein kinase [Streptomyces sp. B1866]|uniref:serine/threonine-protein kinase n=1 Tax=Streptomyces sp. B1866 TaxID=3075431 RepID=UPI002892164A|nr:serine/threonine-protein kinase [Streptomyces sp. B1866]MDT3399917.1 serine/threonine-protein kinase [Streptomyces sp. B1866]
MRLGTRVGGRYRLTKGPLYGGMGEVWLAHDEDLGRDVALKRVRPRDGADAGLDGLRAEARALARLRHPHVVTLYDAVRRTRLGRTTAWLVMEHVPGGNLARRPPIPPPLAAHIGAQTADALAALHAAGLVHCDVKPGNLIASGGTSVKLADFGTAYRVGGDETISPNHSGGYTPGFGAPEVAQGRPPEPRSDVYSLGATVYALIAGEPPGRDGRGDGTTAAEERTSGAYVPAHRAVPAAPGLDADVGPLRDLLTAMLRPDPRDRPGMAEVRERLAAAAGPPALLPALPARAPETTRGLPGERPGRGPLGRPAGAAAAVATAGAVALAVLAVVLTAQGDGKASAGGATRSPSAPPTKDPAAALFGDYRTADPCSLTRATAFDRLGDTELERDYGNFDRCDVVVSRSGRDLVDVHIDLDRDPVSELASPARRSGRVGVVERSAESGRCTRVLTVDGIPDYTVLIEADGLGEAGNRMALCDIADTAAGIAADRLGGGRLPRRSPAYPRDSLLYQDACGMAAADALSVIPGVDARDPEPSYGGWGCKWHSTTTDIDAYLHFDRPTLPMADNSSTTDLQGHRAVIMPEKDGEGTCTVAVAGPSYVDEDGDTAYETVIVEIHGAGRPRDRPCDLATALARSAAATLPQS